MKQRSRQVYTESYYLHGISTGLAIRILEHESSFRGKGWSCACVCTRTHVHVRVLYLVSVQENWRRQQQRVGIMSNHSAH